MRDLIQFFREIMANLPVIRRIAHFNVRTKWVDNYLGSSWDYIEPLLYIGTYYLVFGMGFYNGTVAGQPYLLWMLAAIVPWYYIQGVFNRGLTTVKSQLPQLSKTRFPLSIAVVMPLQEEMRRFLVMTGMFILVMFCYGRTPTIYWFQWFYAVFAMVMMLVAFNLINSTLTILIPDFKPSMSAIFRLLFYSSGVIVNFDSKSMPYLIKAILELSPFNYVLTMFRNSFLYDRWFFENANTTIFFWVFIFVLLVVGAYMHIHFRDEFTDLT